MHPTNVKIVYIIPTLDMDEGGGILEFLYLLISHLDRSYYEVEILVFYSIPNHASRFRDLGASVHIATDKREDNTYLTLFRWLAEKIRKLQPHIVHTSVYWADTLGREVADKCNVPVVMMTEHNTNLNETVDQQRIKKRLSLKTDAVACVTNVVKNYSVKVDGIDADRIEVIPCGFNLDKYAKNIEDINELSRDFYFVGRLVDQKKPLELIEVFASLAKKHPGCRLMCVGDGPLHKKCELLIKSLGMTGTIFLEGYKENPFESVQPGSILLLNSAYEGQGIVLMEAMAQGLLCIASDCGGVPEVIDHNVNGFLFKTNDQDALKRTIEKALKMNRADLNQLRKNAHRKARDVFNPRKMANDYMQLYHRLLENKLVDL
ncbi:MAG: glycosyltransferase family 4 protein [Bacteroidota bacterium]